MDEGCRMSEIPFLAEMQRLARQPIAMCVRVGLARARPLRTHCSMQPQFVTQPPDPGGGDRAMDCLQGCAQAADRTAGRKAACRAVPPVMVRVEKRHVRLPDVGATRAPDNRTCEDKHRISRGPTNLSHRHGIKTAEYACMIGGACRNIVVPIALTGDSMVLASFENTPRSKVRAAINRGWKP